MRDYPTDSSCQHKSQTKSHLVMLSDSETSSPFCHFETKSKNLFYFQVKMFRLRLNMTKGERRMRKRKKQNQL